MLTTILNETIVAGMVVLLHRRRAARLIPCRAPNISRGTDLRHQVEQPASEQAGLPRFAIDSENISGTASL
jgi:hypothetical protein